MNADGTDRTLVQGRISKHRYYFFGRPAWSPDGTQIAFGTAARFTSSNGRRWDFKIYLVNADGSGLTRISSGRQDSWPSWSPDGNQIAFTTRRGLATMNPDGSNRTMLVRGGSDPDWSPDGSQITFVRGVGRTATDVPRLLAADPRRVEEWRPRPALGRTRHPSRQVADGATCRRAEKGHVRTSPRSLAVPTRRARETGDGQHRSRFDIQVNRSPSQYTAGCSRVQAGQAVLVHRAGTLGGELFARDDRGRCG